MLVTPSHSSMATTGKEELSKSVKTDSPVPPAVEASVEASVVVVVSAAASVAVEGSAAVEVALVVDAEAMGAVSVVAVDMEEEEEEEEVMVVAPKLHLRMPLLLTHSLTPQPLVVNDLKPSTFATYVRR